MTNTNTPVFANLGKDLPAGLVVFLVALPLCLGIALASNAPLFSGILAGVIGGIVVGLLSGSHTSVAGPAAGLTAIVAAQIAALKSFDAFLLAVLFAGVIQVGLGLIKAGSVAAFFPSSVIKGLLAAIGLILILKQIPHALGHDPDYEGDFAFQQADQENTFSELIRSVLKIHPGAAMIGLASFALLMVWERTRLKKTIIPAPLVVVVLAVLAALGLRRFGDGFEIESTHLVQVPVAEGLSGMSKLLTFADFSQISNPLVYKAAVTVAIVASLETLLNLEAVDKLDTQKRTSPANRELVAQGIGNMLAGLVGALPMTSVIVRSSVNINAGGKSKISAIFHGILLIGCVLLLPHVLNMIPLSALAAILLATGLKLASPKLFKQMWSEGMNQFLPFVITVGAILLTDLLVGIAIGLGTSIVFILRSNFKRPLHRIMEHHVAHDVLRIELANQVSFLNRAALTTALDAVPSGGHVLIDARATDYIDPDIRDLITDYKEETAPARGVQLSIVGLKDKYQIDDHIQYVDYSTREVQSALTPGKVLDLLRAGNRRFLSGEQLTRDLVRQVEATAPGQYPMAVVLGCMDSRTPIEIVFDVGVGDIFSIRVAGNVAREKVMGGMEYACKVAGSKLIVVMGHTSCGAVGAALKLHKEKKSAEEATGCGNLDVLVDEIQRSIDPDKHLHAEDKEAQQAATDDLAKRNVKHTIDVIMDRSAALRDLIEAGKVGIVGAMYDVRTGKVEFFPETAKGVEEEAPKTDTPLALEAQA